MFLNNSENILDKSGRLKFSVEHLREFSQSKDGNKIALFCNLDGGLSVFSISKWEAIYGDLSDLDYDIAEDRAKLRQIAPWTQISQISKQGRITIPSVFRKKCDLEGDREVIVSGMYTHLEIWSYQRWEKLIKKEVK